MSNTAGSPGRRTSLQHTRSLAEAAKELGEEEDDLPGAGKGQPGVGEVTPQEMIAMNLRLPGVRDDTPTAAAGADRNTYLKMSIAEAVKDCRGSAETHLQAVTLLERWCDADPSKYPFESVQGSWEEQLICNLG